MFLALASLDIPPLTIFELAALVSMVGSVGLFLGAIFTLWLGTKFTSIQNFEAYKTKKEKEDEEFKTHFDSFKTAYYMNKEFRDGQINGMNTRLVKIEQRCNFEHGKQHED
jgi:hypothetical protein